MRAAAYPVLARWLRGPNHGALGRRRRQTPFESSTLLDRAGIAVSNVSISSTGLRNLGARLRGALARRLRAGGDTVLVVIVQPHYDAAVAPKCAALAPTRFIDGYHPSLRGMRCAPLACGSSGEG